MGLAFDEKDAHFFLPFPLSDSDNAVREDWDIKINQTIALFALNAKIWVLGIEKDIEIICKIKFSLTLWKYINPVTHSFICSVSVIY